MRLVRFRGDTFAGHGEHWPDREAVHNDIDIFCLEASEHDLLAGAGDGRIVTEEIAGAASGASLLPYDERRARCDVLGPEAALENQAAGDIPVQWFDVARALRLSLVRRKLFERIGAVDPSAGCGVGPRATPGRHNASTRVRR